MSQARLDAPLVFAPYFRPQVWGERRLQRRLGKRLPPEGRFGESWEISAHEHHVSRVAEGPLADVPLDELWRERASELSGKPVNPAKFPLLIKYLDCHELLSVQVHPTDELARALIGDESGKTEAWVILDAEPTARIYAGLRPGVTRDVLERHLAAGTVAECLHSFVPRPGDCVFLPSGTVHAVGGGVLMAEVQQTSDATFRLFDWNRPGPDGKPRKLHIEESLRSINWSAGPVHPVVPQAIAQGERLVSCEYFEMHRYRLHGSLPLPYPGELSIWLVLDGSAELCNEQGDYRRAFQIGETVLIPAAAKEMQWAASAQGAILLGVRITGARR
jgi:mannose-6-phosphate isomerase